MMATLRVPQGNSPTASINNTIDAFTTMFGRFVDEIVASSSNNGNGVQNVVLSPIGSHSQVRRMWVAATRSENQTEAVEEQLCLVNPEKKDFLSALPEDILGMSIMKFLTPSDIGRLGMCSQFLNQTASDRSLTGRYLWSAHCGILLRRQEPVEMALHARPQLEYMENLLHLANDEIRHWTSCMVADSAFQKFSHSVCKDYQKPICERTVVGLVCNIGMMPSKEISRAVGERRRYAMFSCLVKDTDSAIKFRRSNCNVNESFSFLPINGPESNRANTVANSGLSDLQERALFKKYEEELDGFMGRAVDLLELESEYEFLRYGVLKTMVYRNITVWRSPECMERAAVTLSRKLSQPVLPGEEPLFVDPNLFANPVFLERPRGLPLNHAEEENENNPCIVGFPNLIGTILQRPSPKNCGYDPRAHLTKITSIRDSLLSSIAWQTYR